MRHDEIRIFSDELTVPFDHKLIDITLRESTIALVARILDKRPVRAGDVTLSVDAQVRFVVLIGKQP